jgi:hypothetical protein
MKVIYGWKTELARMSNSRSSVMNRYHGLGRWVGDGDDDFEEEGNLEVDADGDGADTIAPTAVSLSNPGPARKVKKVFRRKS